MNKTNRRIPPRIASCLWSYDLSDLDCQRDRETIITQVLNYGDWKAVLWLYKVYRESEIKRVVAHPRRGMWFKQVLNFWQVMFKRKLPKGVFDRAIISMDPKK